jgi:aminoglycoside phosphotransferase (APT) family kinase protein
MTQSQEGAPQVQEVAKPKTSTRDREDVRRRLERWLEARLPEAAAPRVSGLEAPERNGLSSETLLFEAEWTEAGEPRREALVARLAPDASAVPVFPSYDLERQYRVMELVARHTAVPVPRVFWCETDEAALGAPFFVMERVEGRVPPDVMPYNFGSWLSEAGEQEQRQLQDASIGVLAQLHSIPDAAEVFCFLEIEGDEPTPLARHVADQWGYYEWVADGLCSPLIERCFQWLRDHWPREEGPTGLSWGDARIGNVMYRGFEPVAVLDWEMAALGPPELDVGWLTFQHGFFEDIASKAGLPGMPKLLLRDDVASAYEARTGYAPRDLDFYILYAALRHGIIMSRIARRAIQFGEAEMPGDVDDLIMHRSMLEAMLEGEFTV